MIRPRPTIEHLEDRCVPATWNNPWPDATHLTLSFAPDGTAVGGQSSNLLATLDAVAPRAAWQREILRAFQSWVQHAALNIGLVADGGQDFGTAGRAQGDARFGDIRIGAASFGPSVLAFSSPFDALTGTWSGDVRVNNDVRFSLGGATGVDLYTALLQEAGHVLGINNSPATSSAMYEHYLGVRAGLSAGDIALIQGLYGARQHDVHEGTSGNGTLSSATRLGVLQNMDGVLALAVEGDLTTNSDRDFYTFNAPSVTGGMLIRLERAGLSLVTPKVTVYDSFGRAVGSAVSTDPLGGNLEVRLNSVTPLGKYTVAVEGAGQDFRVGSYRLTMQSVPTVNTLTGGLLGTVNSLGETLVANDLHTNDSFATAQNLPAQLFATASKFDHAFHASLSDRWDVDYYKVTAPSALSGDRTLTVMAWGVGSGNILPRVTVYDAARQLVPVEVLVSEGGSITVQAVGVTAGAAYFVKVEAGAGSGTVGNYFVGIDFGEKATQLRTFVDSELSATRPQESARLNVTAAALFHFVLSAEAGTGTGVEMTITDRNGNVVRRVRAAAGQSTSLTLTLAPGEYTFSFAAYRTDGQPVTPVRYKLRGARVSDPIGPQSEDTTSQPSYSSSSSSSPPPSGSSTSSNTQNDSYWYGWYYNSNYQYSSQSSGGTSYESPSSTGYQA